MDRQKKVDLLNEQVAQLKVRSTVYIPHYFKIENSVWPRVLYLKKSDKFIKTSTIK